MSALDLQNLLNEDWLPVLRDVIEDQGNAEKFIGPDRADDIFPVRELTFRALEAHPPAAWKVVIFGQNPYPRMESATGIACFDGKFKSWGGPLSPTIRNIVKNAAIWKYDVKKDSKIKDLRKLLAKKNVVEPPEWFEFTLLMGCLWLNTALTTGGDIANKEHEKFWKPVVKRIVEGIFEAKHASANPEEKGIVFVLWGGVAQKLRKVIDGLNTHNVPVRFIETYNPAAQGDVFHTINSFGVLNEKLSELGMGEVDWLPSVGWDTELSTSPKKKATKKGKKTKADELPDDEPPLKKAKTMKERDRIKGFMNETIELHAFYMRIASVSDEKDSELPSIEGIMDLPLPSVEKALSPLASVVPDIKDYLPRSKKFAEKKAPALPKKKGLSRDEVAALYLYTCESGLYRQLNAALRSANRKSVKPYFPYLRLFFSAFDKLPRTNIDLWRGVKLDLRDQYVEGSNIVWWGVSSCTGDLSMLENNPMFLGRTGKRTLFHVTAENGSSIKSYSSFASEDEYLLAPGTELKVDSVTIKKDLVLVELVERAGVRHVQ